ncbi:hypothetical protein [Janthinobacterium sp. 1_2014MBL_MicDiv]|uniref:hypothetical protein n=1 Tax=Janthinobacterium sp. 1_2014MBL_MicDiv TaxID=1644131 RepID=UPI0008F5377E|nr:hypothetical protein [Janthinobacterium sp. 1_2014MBL_MicDiv]APA69527.1 hypothetical protein YQ44_19050 [Janthinobacterium sp. 1_2014MBL_MicDiv]
MATYLEAVKLRVARTQISKGPLFNVRPFDAQRAGFTPGKALKTLPAKLKDTYVYYFDGEDRILLVESHGGSATVINRNFYFHEPDKLKSVHFNAGGSLRNVMLSFLDGARIMQDINFGKFGVGRYDYLYEGDRLQSIMVRQREHGQESPSGYQILFGYVDGKMDNIFHMFTNGYQEQRYP